MAASAAMPVNGVRSQDSGEAHARGRRRLLVAIAAALWLARSAHATDPAPYPNRPIRLVLPSTVGGTSDLIARLLEGRLAEVLGQPVVIEARPGASGRIAVERVASAAPDGYTLLLANNGANAIVPARRDDPGIGIAQSFSPVSLLARLPIVIVVSPSLAADTLKDLLALARRAPGGLSYASSGGGSTSHLAAALLFQRADVQLVHVPYSGTSAAVKDVLSGEVPVLFSHLGTVATLVRAGQLRALAVTGDHRMAEFPDLATVAESGYPGYDITTWHGIVAPANTSREIVLRLHAALARVVAQADVRRQLAAMGMEPVGSTPEQFAAAIAADVKRQSALMRDLPAADQ
jgi:tripartite-type tricarboxylate transporter receptor subunit TctC